MLAERRIRRRAGTSAAAAYAQLTREWRQRNRRFFQWGAMFCFIIVSLALLLGLGQLRGWLCGLLAGITLAFYILVRETPPAWIGQYLTGAVGEERTAKAVEPLLRAGWFIAHDLDRGQFNIDHVLVGPPVSTYWRPRTSTERSCLTEIRPRSRVQDGSGRTTRAAGGHGRVARTQPTPTPSSGSASRFVRG